MVTAEVTVSPYPSARLKSQGRYKSRASMTKTVSELLDLLFGAPPKLRRRRLIAR
jgi:hypothetical protein